MVAAAIAILVATIKGISNAYNADAIAAEQAERCFAFVKVCTERCGM